MGDLMRQIYLWKNYPEDTAVLPEPSEEILVRNALPHPDYEQFAHEFWDCGWISKSTAADSIKTKAETFLACLDM